MPIYGIKVELSNRLWRSIDSSIRQHVMRSCYILDTSSLLTKRREDTMARSLLPDDFQQFVPLWSTGDGNCLFNCTSITLHGDEKLAGLLQLLVTCELLAHSEFYANHPQLMPESPFPLYNPRPPMRGFASLTGNTLPMRNVTDGLDHARIFICK